jgi:hypothetical protein
MRTHAQINACAPPSTSRRINGTVAVAAAARRVVTARRAEFTTGGRLHLHAASLSASNTRSGVAVRRRRGRASSPTQPHAFLWWSQEKELRKRWKQLCNFAADEIPKNSPLGGSDGSAGRLLRWIGEYPLTAAGFATAVAGGVSAAISAAVLPVVVGVAVLALPAMLFAFVGTAAVAFVVGALVLTLALPAIGFLSVFGGSIAAAASAKLLPVAIIGTGLVVGAKAIEFGITKDSKALAGANDDDKADAWSPRNVNANADDDEEDIEETVKRRFDERLAALDASKRQNKDD